MEKKSKIFGVLLIVLAVLCIGMYFAYGMIFGSHKVKFDTDGGSTVSEQVVKNGETAMRPDNPTKDGSDFIEWQLNGEAYDFDSAVNKDITLKAIWQSYNMLNVIVKLDNNEYTTTVRDGEQLIVESLSIPSKEGYLIKLYYEDGKEYDLSNIVTSDLSLIAKYVEIKKYTVKFDSNGGTKVSDAKVVEGEFVLEPTVTRDGYVFAGWYLGNEKYDFQTPITKAITLKAKWNDAGKVTVTFTADDKTYKTVQVKIDAKVSKPDNPTKKGYKFVEWQLNGTTFDFNTKITEDITLTAKFEEAKTYTVTFNSDGGSSVKSQEVTSKATKPANPTKNGFTFVEWQLNGKTYDFNKEVVEDITLKAKWEEEKPKYTVNFDSDGGSSVASQTVTKGDKATKPTNPTKSGYVFVEWLKDNQTYDFNNPVVDNIKLTAFYRALPKYTVTFNSDGGSEVAIQTVVEGEKVPKPANPTKNGFTFVEWQLNDTAYDFNKAITSSITLKAKWQADSISNPDIIPSEDGK